MMRNWNCEACHQRIGDIEDGKITIRRTNTPTYLEILARLVIQQCPRCGAENRMEVQDDLVQQ